MAGIEALASPSPSRESRLRNPCTWKKPASRAGSGGRATSVSIAAGSGVWSSSSTSRREIRAFSAFSSSASRRLGCLISPARASSVSRSPYSLMSWAAVLMPMPGTPGTLSVASPASAWTSTTLSGVTPNFSKTSGSRIGFCLIGSSMITPARMSCIKSLSELTMVVRPPSSSIARA